jgi:hypothetical protein
MDFGSVPVPVPASASSASSLYVAHWAARCGPWPWGALGKPLGTWCLVLGGGGGGGGVCVCVWLWLCGVWSRSSVVVVAAPAPSDLLRRVGLGGVRYGALAVGNCGASPAGGTAGQTGTPIREWGSATRCSRKPTECQLGLGEVLRFPIHTAAVCVLISRALISRALNFPQLKRDASPPRARKCVYSVSHKVLKARAEFVG